ncbi:hypothetical protein CLAFUW4_11577 [Fulvia fulva]|uniref:DUF7626 domain-containing protein n=1 Tax=Passalora fulva TaxID=5499 RepID=A0A9Q8URP3_PASFU|nr:uncharacterized protein CLAFUR5_10620 [Fulvia fulva]KAK4620396.1 hypothetical protein CLAFUR0_11591 [Fulvia fulva]UJO20019.1 hypothetical protein CLAFUR5_10620 [Fulvia fulva]WPV17333.1 hypothetical protein CLAFUW4_11577 [Fulvia fulva]WPV32531.1 hypothetical protein CLAFUW7_11581 [Fulvia fulva]
MDGIQLAPAWFGAPIPDVTGRDEAIAAGAELEELGIKSDPDSDADDSDADRDPDPYNPLSSEARKAARAATKTPRVTGGIAAIAKPIRAEYDSDDGRIIELKQQGYADVYVANKLKEEGRMRYEPKTVGSRWLRLRKLLERIENERLDDELSDWHEGEDDKLHEVCEAVEKRYVTLRENLEKKKWEDIQSHMADKLGRKKYTANACKERYDDLRAGTALLPIELDRDQAGRRKLREDRIAAAKQARADAEAEVRRVDEEKKERANQKKREQAESNQRRVAEALRKASERKERARIKQEREINRARLRDRRKAVLAMMRAEREWETARNRAEKKLYQKLTGVDIDGMPIRTRRQSKYEPEEDEAIDEFESDDEDEEEPELTDAESDEDEDQIHLNDSGSEADDEQLVQVSSRKTNKRTPRRSTRKSASKAPIIDSPNTSPITPQQETATVRIEVTEDTLINPRSIMSDNELDLLLHKRSLPKRDYAAGESHAEVVAYLAYCDSQLTTTELDNLLSRFYLKKKGKKSEKILLLQEADAKASHKGSMGLSSVDQEFIEGYGGYAEHGFEHLVQMAEEDENEEMQGVEEEYGEEVGGGRNDSIME